MSGRPKPTVLLRARPEIPEDRRSWRPKPWVRRAIGTYRRGRRFVVLVGPPRGRTHDPARSAAKRAEKRARQSKDRR